MRRHHIESTQLKARLWIQAQSCSGLLKERGEDTIVCTVQSNNIRRRSIALEDRYPQWCLHLVCGLEVCSQARGSDTVDNERRCRAANLGSVNQTWNGASVEMPQQRGYLSFSADDGRERLVLPPPFLFDVLTGEGRIEFKKTVFRYADSCACRHGGHSPLGNDTSSCTCTTRSAPRRSCAYPRGRCSSLAADGSGFSGCCTVPGPREEYFQDRSRAPGKISKEWIIGGRARLAVQMCVRWHFDGILCESSYNYRTVCTLMCQGLHVRFYAHGIFSSCHHISFPCIKLGIMAFYGISTDINLSPTAHGAPFRHDRAQTPLSRWPRADLSNNSMVCIRSIHRLLHRCPRLLWRGRGWCSGHG